MDKLNLAQITLAISCFRSSIANYDKLSKKRYKDETIKEYYQSVRDEVSKLENIFRIEYDKRTKE